MPNTDVRAMRYASCCSTSRTWIVCWVKTRAVRKRNRNMIASNGHAPKAFRRNAQPHIYVCSKGFRDAASDKQRAVFAAAEIARKAKWVPLCIACQVIPKSLWLRLVLVSGLPFLLLFLDFSQNADILPAGAEQLRALLTTEAHLCGGVGNFVFKYAHIHALHIVGQIPQRHVPRTGVVRGDSLRVNSLHAVFYI